MSDVTQILSQIESGDPSTADRLLPLVYDELRSLAARKMAQEKPRQTLQATAILAMAVPLTCVPFNPPEGTSKSRRFLMPAGHFARSRMW